MVETSPHDRPLALHAHAAGRRYHYAIRGGRLGVLVALLKRMDQEMPALTALVRAPHKTVAQAAANTDLTPAMVLRCLDLVLRGANPSRGRSGTLSIALAPNATEWGRRQGQARAERLIADRDFGRVLRSLRYARDSVVVPWSRGAGSAPTDATGDLINDIGDRIDGDAGHARQLSHLLDGAQAAISRAVLEKLGPGGGLTSSGWISKTRMDVRQLKRAISERTGYRVGISSCGRAPGKTAV